MDIMDEVCTVYRTMAYLSKKWSMLILLELYKRGDDTEGWMRFSEIRISMSDITPKILSERLKELEGEGLVEKRVTVDSFPIKSEYRLTESALELMAVVHDLKMWALKWKIDNVPCMKQDCRNCTL